MALTMKEYAQNTLYSELIAMPLWTVSAFGSLEDGDVLQPDDVRHSLIVYLATTHLNKVPHPFYDNEYRHSWSAKDFKECIKQAVKTCKDTLYKQNLY